MCVWVCIHCGPFLQDKADSNNDVVVVCDSSDECDTVESILAHHSRKVLDILSSSYLEVDRSSKETLWLSVVAFYKSCKMRPEKLTKELVIRFKGEAGADSGALRREFFEDAIREANLNLLEGDDECRSLKKDWGMEATYEMMGSLVAHSVIQNGTGLSCMSPAVYDYLSNQTSYPEVADIPLSLCTHELISLISKVVC